MRYGRIDVSGPEQCPEEGRLPGRLTMHSLGVVWKKTFSFSFLQVQVGFIIIVMILEIENFGK